jgi:uncharacterized protein (TIGR03000 family)
MGKIWLSAALLAVLGLPGNSFAGKGGGGGHGGGGHSGGHSSAGHGGFYGGGSHGGYYHHGGYYPGIYLGLGGYGYGYGPSYYPDYSYGEPGSSYYYAPSVLPPAPTQDTTRALIEVRVPAEAEIWFEGDKTSQTGSVRQFVTPPVTPGKMFTYDIRARWTGADGKPVDLQRSVQFQAGQRLTVDFVRP